MITAVVLNWQRPNIIQQVTIPILAKCPHVDELIVAHTSEDNFFDIPEGDDRLRIQHLKMFDPALGMKVRWVAAMEARNEHILSIDDDVLVSPESLNKLCESYMQEPDVIHGCFARAFRDAELRYSSTEIAYGRMALVLTGLGIQGKAVWEECLKLAPQVEDILRDDLKWWDGEDIFGALVAIKRSKKLNRSHNLPFTVELRMRRNGIRISTKDQIDALRAEQRSAIIARCADIWDLRDMLWEQQELKESSHKAQEPYYKSRFQRIARRVCGKLQRLNPSMRNPRFALSGFAPSWWQVLVQNGVSKAPSWSENLLEVCDENFRIFKPLQPVKRDWNWNFRTLPVLPLEQTFYSHASVPGWFRDKNVDRVILCLQDPRAAYSGVAAERIAKRLEAEKKAVEAGMPISLLWLHREEQVRAILPVQVAPLEESERSGWGAELPALYQNAYVFWLRQWCLEYEPENLLILPFEAVPEEADKIAGFLGLANPPVLEPAKKGKHLAEDAKALLNDFYRPHVGALKELLQERGLWSQSWENSAWMNEIGVMNDQ